MQEDVKSLFCLLEKKNDCLLKFHKLNNSEIGRLTCGCQDNLDNFYHAREALLAAIDKADKRIAAEEKAARFEARKEEKKKLKKLLRLKRDLVLSILDQDLVILSLMNGLREDDQPEAPKTSRRAASAPSAGAQAARIEKAAA